MSVSLRGVRRVPTVSIFY